MASTSGDASMADAASLGRPGTPPPAPATNAQLWCWASFDWAYSPFFSVVLTFVFATYFTQVVAPDPVRGTAWWGWAITASAVVIAIVSPVAGAIGDVRGRRKPWLLLFVLLSAVATANLWWVTPGPAMVLLALVLVG